jgi:hypothetical protein
MSKQGSARIETGTDAAPKSADPAPPYEPPRLDGLGSFEELTGQDLKTSGGTDFVNFFS